MTKLEKELTIKVKRLEDDCKAYNFTQHTLQEEGKKLKAQIEKMEYALNKIIKTVHNDNISGYGDRLVTIYDISCEVLQEIKENG